MMTNDVVFKGTADGIRVILPAGTPWPQLRQQLQKRLEASQSFLKGAELIIETGARPLTASLMSDLARMTGDFDEIELRRIESQRVKNENERRAPRAAEQPLAVAFDRGSSDEIEDDSIPSFQMQASHIWTTVRSGQVLHHDGNLCIHGNVNPGGKVECSADVFVLGTLRGVVHAGRSGDPAAIVYAESFRAPLVRIGSEALSFETASFDLQKGEDEQPLVAYRHRGHIRLAPWSRMIRWLDNLANGQREPDLRPVSAK